MGTDAELYGGVGIAGVGPGTELDDSGGGGCEGPDSGAEFGGEEGEECECWAVLGGSVAADESS